MSVGDDGTGRWLSAVVSKVTDPVSDTRIIELVPATGRLPGFEPGAHVAVQCGELVRHYSLFGPPQDPLFYRIAVKREAHGRGGSEWLFQNAAVGAPLSISAPRNNFPLVRGGQRYLFIAGGIGVTPILAMLDALRGEGIRARLAFLCRSPQEFAFGDELRRHGNHHDIHLHFDSHAGALYDIAAELRGHDAATEVYCCGPAPLMDAVRRFAEEHGRVDRFHFEYFSAEPTAPVRPDTQAEFSVIARRSGREVRVGRDESVLAALRRIGIPMESDCEDGVCGTCVVRVLAGEPEHRDFALTRAQRESGLMITCVSRARTGQLVLDV